MISLKLENINNSINSPIYLIVLPELFSTGYYFDTYNQLMEIAEEIPDGYTTKRLIEIAKSKNCNLVGAIVEKANDSLYISAIIVGPKGYIGKQRKRHLTDYESNFFPTGNESEVFDINGCKIGVIICFEG